MNVKLQSQRKELTAFLSGEIDHHTATTIRLAIDGEIELKRPAVLYLDFSAVTFMDSSGIGLIMGRYRLMSINRGRLEVINVPKNLERMVNLSGITTLGILKDERTANV